MKKKLIIILSSLFLICFAFYLSVSLHSKASSVQEGFEQYYDEDEAKNNVDQVNYSKDDSKLNVHKNAILDTTPTSILVFVNKEFGLPSDYIPDDLVVPNVSFNIHYYDEKKLMRKDAASALEDLFTAALEDNIALCGVSGYRSYKRQESIYTKNILLKGAEYTNKYSAKPGYSEHQTGLSIDVSASSVGYGLEPRFGETKEGKWLAENCYKYGFIIRYPDGKSDITGYSYEPWHIRYVGIEVATYLYKNDLTLEEYYHYIPTIDFDEVTAYDKVVDESPISPSKEPEKTIAPTSTPKPTTTPTPKDEDNSDLETKETPKPSKKPTEDTDKTPIKKTPAPTVAPTSTPKVTTPPEEEIEPTAAPTEVPTDSEEVTAESIQN